MSTTPTSPVRIAATGLLYEVDLDMGAVLLRFFDQDGREVMVGLDANMAAQLGALAPGDEDRIVLEHPAELGIQWDDSGDLLALTADRIVLTPRGVDAWELDPSEARELAAHLAAMADALGTAHVAEEGH